MSYIYWKLNETRMTRDPTWLTSCDQLSNYIWYNLLLSVQSKKKLLLSVIKKNEIKSSREHNLSKNTHLAVNVRIRGWHSHLENGFLCFFWLRNFIESFGNLLPYKLGNKGGGATVVKCFIESECSVCKKEFLINANEMKLLSEERVWNLLFFFSGFGTTKGMPRAVKTDFQSVS